MLGDHVIKMMEERPDVRDAIEALLKACGAAPPPDPEKEKEQGKMEITDERGADGAATVLDAI